MTPCRMLMFISSFFLLFSLQAQTPLLNKAKNKVKQRGQARTEQKADEVIDKGLDKLEEALFGKKNPPSDSTTSSQQQTSSVPDYSSTFPEDSTYAPDVPFDSGYTTPIPNSFGGFNFGGPVEPFPTGDFEDGIGEEGVVGKGPFGHSSAYWIQLTTTETAGSIKTEIHDTLSFMDYGLRSFRIQAQQQSIRLFGISQDQLDRTFSLTLEDSVYSWHPAEQRGYRFANPYEKMYGGMSEEELHDFAEEVEQGMNTTHQRLGTEVIAGKRCEVWEFTTLNEAGEILFLSRIWFWKGMTLQSLSRGMGSEIMTQTVYLDTSPSFPKELFQRPPHVQFQIMNLPVGN